MDCGVQSAMKARFINENEVQVRDVGFFHFDQLSDSVLYFGQIPAQSTYFTKQKNDDGIRFSEWIADLKT